MQMRLNFFFSVSDRTLTFKNEHCRGGKNSNERITVCWPRIWNLNLICKLYNLKNLFTSIVMSPLLIFFLTVVRYYDQLIWWWGRGGRFFISYRQTKSNILWQNCVCVLRAVKNRRKTWFWRSYQYCGQIVADK